MFPLNSLVGCWFHTKPNDLKFARGSALCGTGSHIVT